MNTYIYIGRGYSHGGWGGYCNVTVVKGETAMPSWRNKAMTVIEGPDLLYAGEESERSEFVQELRRLKREYPDAIIIDRSRDQQVAA